VGTDPRDMHQIRDCLRMSNVGPDPRENHLGFLLPHNLGFVKKKKKIEVARFNIFDSFNCKCPLARNRKNW